MTDELFSLRAIVVSGSPDDHELFRQAAAALPVPVEVVEADGVAAARGALVGGADLVFVDAGISRADIATILAMTRAERNRAFTVLLTAQQGVEQPFDTDALADKPMRLEDARRLLERAIRLRLPSRVLVVDDSATMRSIVRKLLASTRFAFEVSEADEGFAALKQARESEFDLVFLDYNMPGFSGFETLSEFKREKRRVSVVIMTSMTDAALGERARELGAAFLKKPFFPADIEDVLCGYYGLRALNPKRA